MGACLFIIVFLDEGFYGKSKKKNSRISVLLPVTPLSIITN